ncbi:MAG: cytochrome c biogenesis protein ResB [Cyanobacteria bacterium P01_D01_bin.6]
MDSRVIRFLGSIRLAVPLLVAIAVILIGATFYESEVGSPTVQREIYKSAWFGALMFLLAVNLGLSTLSRFPWQGPRKVGFALTHWGLVVIIAGSAAVIHLSTEGMLLVRTDSSPGNQIRVEGDLLEVVAPDQTRQQTDIFIKPDGSVYPQQFAGLSLLGYSDNAIKAVQFTDDGAVENLAVKVQLSSERMGQTLERWLAVAPTAYSQMDVGPAHLELFQARDEAELQTLLRSPSASQNVMGELRVEQVAGTQGDRTFDVEQVLGQSLSVSPDITLEVTNVWPDFRLNGDGQPTSASEQFQNPAVQLLVTQGERQERWFLFGKAGLSPVRSNDAIDLSLSYEPPISAPTDYLRLVEAPSHQIFYAAASSKGFKSGELQAGDVITPGWADFQISLMERLDQARVQRQLVPVMPVAQGTLSTEGAPALHVATPDGQDFWLPWGEPTDFASNAGQYFAAFTPKLLPLPFYVKLNDFIVERNEGSESVAMWTSDITLFDAQTDTAMQRSVWMNHPTWFRGWKLAQASWNPGDLQQSTLQLKREPWWVTALTWTGSLLVVMGIAVMFYGPSLLKKWRHWTRSPASGEVAAPTAVEASEEKPVGTIPILAVFGK